MTDAQAIAVANLCTTMTLHGWTAERVYDTRHEEWVVIRSDGTFWTQGGRLTRADAVEILLANAK